ncbi:LysR family transcriptional regulator [Streptomyces sp. NPDC102384]|uniref:LysR family transcriptional regulator n=1 Tax=unclassified Streptomyces TaxID=2593676 RepID=UPI002E26DDB3
MPLVDPALKYFIAVFETGSVNAAARRLFVAASAVSRQLARLEREVGAPLFDRLPSGVIATPAGRAFAGFARRAIQDAEAFTDEVHQRRTTRAVITVAATIGVTHHLLPDVAAGFHAAHPEARVILHVARPTEATQMVAEGIADFGVTFNIALPAGVSIRYTQEAPLCAIVRRGHPLADKQAVSVRDLVRHPVALPSTDTTSRLLLEASAAAHQLTVEGVFECTTVDALLRFVRASSAVTLASRVTLGPSDRRALAAVPLEEKEFRQRTLQVQCRAGRELPPAAADFMDRVIDALGHRAV